MHITRKSVWQISLMQYRQYGINDEAVTEIHRLSYRKLSKVQNDATANFDSMIRKLINLCHRFFEVSDQVYKLQVRIFTSNNYTLKVHYEYNQTLIQIQKNILYI